MKSLHQTIRTRILFITMLFSKLSLLICYIAVFLTISTYLDIKNEELNIDVRITSSPITMCAIYFFSNLFLLCINQSFFLWDQYHSYSYPYPIQRFQSGSKILALMYKPKSCTGVIVHSAFLTYCI